MVIQDWSLEKVLDGIKDELPLGLWCIKLDDDTITGYEKFQELVGINHLACSISDFCKHIREDYRDVIANNISEIHRSYELDVTFPTNKFWLNMHLTHYDEAQNKAYGYIAETSKVRKVTKDMSQDEVIRETQFLNLVLNDISLYNIEDAAEKIITDLMTRIQADRISIIAYDFEKQTQSCTHSVQREGIESRKRTFNGIPFNVTPIINKSMISDEIISIYDTSQLNDKEIIEANIIYCNKNKSLLLFPLRRAGETFAYMVIDYIHNNKSFNQLELDWIRIISRFVEISIIVYKRSIKSIDSGKQFSKLLDILPFGYLQLKIKYDTTGTASDLIIVSANQRFEYYIGKSGIVDKMGSFVFGKENRHILSKCIDVTHKGYHMLVDDFLIVNDTPLSADISMTNINEFVCIVSHSNKALREAVNINLKKSSNYEQEKTTELNPNIVYSLKTQLNTILGFCELLSSDNDLENHKKYVDMIKDNAEQLRNSDIMAEMDTNANDQTKTSTNNTQKNNGNYKILVAEDTESNYMLLTYILKDNYTLYWAHDGIEAIEMYEQEKPDLILMDVRMPRMSGLTATMRIRETDKEIPIIALTAFAFESDKAKTLEAGCTDFIPKPIIAAALKELVAKYLK